MPKTQTRDVMEAGFPLPIVRWIQQKPLRRYVGIYWPDLDRKRRPMNANPDDFIVELIDHDGENGPCTVYSETGKSLSAAIKKLSSKLVSECAKILDAAG